MRAALKRRKADAEVVHSDLIRHLPKAFGGEIGDLDIIDIGFLQRVKDSKTTTSTRNERPKDRGRGPTAERLGKASGFHSVGDDKQGGRTYTMQDSPLDRLWARQRIDPVEYSALQRYKHHWYHGGLQAAVGSVDLNRVFASDPGSMSGMSKSERQYHHRDQWRKAREIIGHRPGIIVDNIVCAEHSLEVAGYSIGYASPFRAREAAREILRDAGYRLSRHWGIG